MPAIATESAAPPVGRRQPGPSPEPRPVVLQVNRSGIWHKVAEFDAGDKPAEAYMMEACELLCQVDFKTQFRIVAKDLGGSPLLQYSVRDGWVKL